MKWIIFSLATLVIFFHVSAQPEPTLVKAEKHPMQYYVSLPQGWSKDKTWPVVVVLEAAAKEYKANAERFIAARENMPFILVAPFHTNNGNYGRRDPKLFPYSSETWDYMEFQAGECDFNDQGILATIKEVSEKYRGDSKVFITGFEAGAHQLWSVVFNHPEVLKAAVPVDGNFRLRCVYADKISKDPSKTDLPIHSFLAAKEDPNFPASGILLEQWKQAKALAQSNGYKNITEQTVDVVHQPMPKEVLKYFSDLLEKK